MVTKKKFRSKLSIAKNLGSAKSGHHHWLNQRLTAILITILVIWMVNFSWKLFNSNIENIFIILKDPFHLTMLTCFTLSSLYHAYLGMQVVIEDYVHCLFARNTMLISMKIFGIITAIAFIIAILNLIKF